MIFHGERAVSSIPAISVVDVHKSFGPLAVLKGVSFDVPRGAVVSMIGASGSGKSTLLRCINHLETPSAGEIYIDGEPMHKLRSIAEINRMRRDLGMVFQQFNLWPHMTVLGNVVEAQQRVAIARALAMQPKAMLFDEATSSLDPELTDEVLAVMRDLARDGTTMIVVTHEMRIAREVSDRVLFLHNGLIEEAGSPEAVFGAPKSERCRQFLSKYLQ